MMIISPDEGAMNRAVYFANVIGVDMGMFYKRRDYSVIVDGKNPIVAHEFLGNEVEGKDVIIIDDMIASGDSMIDTAKELKKRKAGRIFICATFGLFTKGLERMDAFYKEGLFDKIVTTNLIYQSEELKKKPYYLSADMSRFLAMIIDSLNHDIGIGRVMSPTEKIQVLTGEYNQGKEE